MPKAMGSKAQAGSYSKNEQPPEKNCGRKGPSARGATSRQGNTDSPGTKSGSSVIHGGSKGRGSKLASGGSKMKGHQDNRSY